MALVYGRIMLIMQLSLVIVAATITRKRSSQAASDQSLLPPQAKPHCSDHCGDLKIPYPFGIGDGCYLLVPGQGQPFNITCDQSTKPPSANWTGTNILVTKFNLSAGDLQIKNYIARDCYDAQGNRIDGDVPYLSVYPPFTIDSDKNKFFAVGCDTNATFQGFRGEEELITGCISVCKNLSPFDSESCSGVGCCQIKIPRALKNNTLRLSSFKKHKGIWGFNPCSYAFVVQDGHFTFNSTSFKLLKNIREFPMVLNWEIGNEPCHVAEKRTMDYACKKNTKCVNRTSTTGYYCQCLPGYEGNPYLGCQDIDECKASVNPCKNGRCKNQSGNFSCHCDSGYRNENGNMKTCITNNTSLKISLGICIGFSVLLVGIFWIYCGMKRKKFNRLKKKYFEDNGGTKLQQKLGSCTEATAKIFTREELKKATNNYHADEILGEGGYGTVYKGTLPNKTLVAIKKSKIFGTSQSDHFVNEVIDLSQIKHKNVVRLLGCCLETEMPLLVYEFVSNGTLYDHIHRRNGKGPLSLALRLKIVAETAELLSYLHYSTSMQIVHRDVKTTNVLLDEKFTAKVADFGASKLVPKDEAQLSTLVQGTMGYLDPEYLQSNTFTEKSDVYSFGVVLVELLTSRRALSFDKPEAERSLAHVFVCAAEDGLLKHILDEEVVRDGHFETVESVADLAKRCLSVKGSERPTMREVARELEGLQILPKHSGGGKPDSSSKETDYLLASPSNAYVVDVRGEGKSEGDSGSITPSID